MESLSQLEEEYLQSIVEDVKVRYRFSDIDNVLPAPRYTEMRAAALDAISEINAFPPSTDYTLTTIRSSGYQSGLRYLLLVGTAKNTIRTLMFDFASNGFSQNYGEFSIENRVNDYRSIYNELSEEFGGKLREFKPYYTKVIKRVDPQNQSMLRSAAYPFIRRTIRYY